MPTIEAKSVECRRGIKDSLEGLGFYLRPSLWRLKILFGATLIGLAIHPSQADDNQTRPTLLVRSTNATNDAIAISPDGEWYVTLTRSGTVTIWRSADGFEYRSFTVGAAESVSVGTDRRTIAVASRDQVRLFDVHTAKQTSNFKLPDIGTVIVRLEFHPKRMLLAMLDTDGTVRVRDLATNLDLFKKSIGPQSTILHFSRDGSYLAAGSQDTAHVWAWEQGREIANFNARKVHSSDLKREIKAMVISPAGSRIQEQTTEQAGFYHFNDFVFSADAQRLALVQKDEINVMALPTRTRIDVIPSADGEILTCIFLDPYTIVSGVLAGSSFRFDMRTHLRTPFPAYSAQQFLAVPNTNRLLISSGDKVGIREATGNGQWISFTQNRFASFSGVEQFSPNGNQLLVGTFWATSPMTVWDFVSGRADTLAIPVRDVGTFALSPDGKRIAYYGSEGYPNFNIHVWNRAARREELSLPIVVPGTKSLAFSRDGTRLAALIGQPKSLKVWSIPDGHTITSIPLDEDPFNHLSWASDGRVIAVTQQKAGVLIISVDDRRVVRTLNPEPNGDLESNLFSSTQFSPDGKFLAVEGANQIDLIDSSTWAVFGTIPKAGGLCFDISPDSRFIAYLPTDLSAFTPQLRGVAIWDLQERKIVAHDPTNSTNCPIAYHPNGKFLATGLAGGIGVLSVSTAETLATLFRFGNDQSIDWLAVTPDGLFDGTEGAWNQAGWRFSDDTFDVSPLEIYFNEFFYPGLLSDIIAGKRPKAPAEIALKDRRQPVVGLTSHQ